MDGLIIGAVLILAGAALLWVAWAGSQGTLPPNGFVGIRVPATRCSDAAWYAAHRAAAGPLGIGGAITATCGVGVLFAGFDVIGLVLALIALATTLSATGIATVVALRAARTA